MLSIIHSILFISFIYVLCTFWLIGAFLSLTPIILSKNPLKSHTTGTLYGLVLLITSTILMYNTIKYYTPSLI